MDWSLIVFLVIVLFFGYRGFRRGLLRSLGRILGIAAGYACAILYTDEAARLVEAETQLRGVVAFIVAALGLFAGASIAVGLLFWVLAKLLGEDGRPSWGSRTGGAAVGAATGLVVAIVVIWSVAFVRDTRPNLLPQSATVEEPSPVEELANTVAGKAVGSAMSLGSASPEIVRMTAALAESPGEIVQRAQRLGRSEEMSALLHDPNNQAVLNSGDIQAVRELPAFQRLLQNPDMLALAESTGLLDDAAASSLGTEEALARQLTDIWGRAQNVKTDPRVREILADPEFRQKVQSGNPLDLLGNDQLLELANIIFGEDAAPASVPTGETGDTGAARGAAQPPQDSAAGASGKKIYTWTDERGQLHVSDEPPDN